MEQKDNSFSKDYTELKTFIAKHKGWAIGYAVWLVINITFLLFGGESYKWSNGFRTEYWSAKKVFFPFSGHAANYDFTEFFVYVVALPVLVYAAYFFFKKYKK